MKINYWWVAAISMLLLCLTECRYKTGRTKHIIPMRELTAVATDSLPKDSIMMIPEPR